SGVDVVDAMTGGRVRVRIDPAKCTGHGQCAANAPEVYELDDLGYAVPMDGPVPDGLEAQAKLGAGACPERAIAVVE
ncbi:ferredoxin, partial [Mycolicibacterium sp. XJ1819]